MASAVEWTSSVVGDDSDCPRPKLAAVVFPQYHSDQTNNDLWGEGYTEWVALNGTTDPLLPRPIEPLGYYDLMAEGTMETQAEMARDHGIDAFFYYHYWFGDGRRVLDAPVEKMLKTKSPDFPFALVWALESWTPRWHGKNQTSHFEDIDTSEWPTQNVTVENMRKHLVWLETEVWSDPRYVHIDGRPVFILHGGGPGAAVWSAASLIMDVCRESSMNPYVGIVMRGVRPMTLKGHRDAKLLKIYNDFFTTKVTKFDFSLLWEARTDGLSNLMDSVVDTAVCDARELHDDAMTSPDLAAVDWELGAFAGFDNFARHPTASHLAVRLSVDEDRTGRDRPAELKL